MKVDRLLPLAASALLVALGAAAWPFTIDDAYILARYARRIATGAGYTMVAGPPTDGVTGPLALVPGLLGQLGWGDPVAASKIVGLLAAALAAWLVIATATRISTARGVATSVLVVGGATFSIWSVAGLATGLATLGLTIAGLAVLAAAPRQGRAGQLERVGAPPETPGSTTAPGVTEAERVDLGWAPGTERAQGLAAALNEALGPAQAVPEGLSQEFVDARPAVRWRALGASAGLAIAALAWLRPELALASGVLLVALWRWDRRAGALALCLAAAGAVSVIAFRLALFGSPLPLSAQAKPPDLVNGAEYVGRAMLVELGGGGALVVVLAARAGGPRERLLFAVLLAHLVALVLAGGDWMPGFRLMAPVIPLYALLASEPVAARWPASKGKALALLAACALLPALDLAVELPRARAAGAAREAAGTELATSLAASRRVALVDVGWLAYRSGVEVVDLGGVTDPSIGRLAGGHLDKRIDPALLQQRAPATIVLHSAVPPRVDEEGRLRWLAGYPVEQRVASMGWVRAEMRVERVIAYAPGYYYVVLGR